jgi:cation diffusion facilitator CzcD-associated flavoprotein CzcO
MEDVIIIIGAGQAGLGVSYFLKCGGIGHIVLERSRMGESWRSRSTTPGLAPADPPPPCAGPTTEVTIANQIYRSKAS